MQGTAGQVVLYAVQIAADGQSVNECRWCTDATVDAKNHKWPVLKGSKALGNVRSLSYECRTSALSASEHTVAVAASQQCPAAHTRQLPVS
jgi:hypothetical protein